MSPAHEIISWSLHHLAHLHICFCFNDLQKGQRHPVWGCMDNYAAEKDKRKQLLLMLCQHEADRLEVWAHPNSK